MLAVTENPMVPVLHRVQRVRKESYDTFTLELTVPDGAKHTFAPGQFSMLYVFGFGEAPISISGDPAKTGTFIYTIREVGTVTCALGKLKTGDSVGVRGPFGSQWDLDAARGKDVIIIAGGIGLAPLRPAIYSLLARRDEFKGINILYGARTPKDILYMRELENWRGRFDLEVEVTVDRARRDWRGNVGVVPKLIGKMNFDPENTIAMICGPEVMMRFTMMELHSQGLADESIYVTMERNMKCAVGFCGHCQFGPHFICKDGPVFRFSDIKPVFGKREI